MNSNSDQPVALITGVSSGIGQAVAAELKDKGYRIVGVSRQADACEYECLQADLCSPDELKQLFVNFRKLSKRLDVLVHAAGIFVQSPLMMTSDSQLEKVFSLNTLASLRLSREASKLMMRSKCGSMIHFSSVVAAQGVSGQAVYSATKGAVESMTRALAQELGPMGIRVNAIAPGFIDTPLVAEYSQEQKDQIAQKTALGRIGNVQDISGLACFLASNAAGYITGQTLTVDGGLRL